ncbi:MAG: sulfatase-like hydrolase/transferase, partial [Woeseia sp.]
VISSAIDALKSESDRIDASLTYVSDHGESLGEHGLYLHGMPYRLAPDEQTQVPMLVWVSDREARQQRMKEACAVPGTAALPDAAVSHDNLFHTERGLLGIETEVYYAQLDLYSACRRRSALADNTAPGMLLE